MDGPCAWNKRLFRAMGRREIESTTDSELAQRISATQPYNVVEIVITTANPARQLEDGSTEFSAPSLFPMI